MTRVFSFGVALTILFGGLPHRAVAADVDLSRFPLAKAIPDNVFIAVAERSNPERQFLDDYWAEVTQAFVDSGVLTDVWDVLSDYVPDENLDEFEDAAGRLCELSGEVDWGSIFGKEFVHAGRMDLKAGPSPYTGLFMGRSDKDQAKANYTALKMMLDRISVDLLGKLLGEGAATMTERQDEGVAISTLRLRDLPQLSLHVAYRDDVILISFWDDSMLNESIALLKGSSKVKRLSETARFQDAFSQLPPAEDTMVFFDAERMLVNIRTLFTAMNQATAQGVQQNSDSAPKASWLRAISTFMDDISIIDYVASVEWTEGHRVFSDSITTVRRDAKSSPLYKIATSGAPLNDFEKFIPKEAETFEVSAGMNYASAYDYLKSFVSKNIPRGKVYVREIEAKQKKWELDIRKDLLGLLEGSTASAKMGKDWMYMLKVTDDRKFEQQVDRLIGLVNERLPQEASLMITRVDVGAKNKFKQISHPMMMFMGGGMSPPILGCAEGYFIIGSSEKMVKTCLNTSKGKHPSIRENQRWQKEAVAPDKGAITTISFKDETQYAQELQELVSSLSMAMMGMGLGMSGAFGGELPSEMETAITVLPPILAKLGPVAGKLDFYQSTSSYETFDGQKWYTHSVQNYKKPKKKGIETAKKKAR